MLLECSVHWEKGIQVEGVVYTPRAEDGLYEIDNAAHAEILLTSDKWTVSPKAVFRKVEPKASARPAPPPPPPRSGSDVE